MNTTETGKDFGEINLRLKRFLGGLGVFLVGLIFTIYYLVTYLFLSYITLFTIFAGLVAMIYYGRKKEIPPSQQDKQPQSSSQQSNQQSEPQP